MRYVQTSRQKRGQDDLKKVIIIAPNLASWSTKEGRFVFGLTTIKPKKPKFGPTKNAKVKLSTGKFVLAAIPGQGHSLQQHSGGFS